MMIHQDMLDEGKIEDLVAALRSLDSSGVELAGKIRIEAGYYENHTERMRHSEFRRQHLLAGSGAIEAGCKTVIGSLASSRPCAGPTPSWHCAAGTSTPAWRTTGRPRVLNRLGAAGVVSGWRVAMRPLLCAHIGVSMPRPTANRIRCEG